MQRRDRQWRNNEKKSETLCTLCNKSIRQQKDNVHYAKKGPCWQKETTLYFFRVLLTFYANHTSKRGKSVCCGRSPHFKKDGWIMTLKFSCLWKKEQ